MHTRFTDEQRAMLIELFEKPKRPNETQMYDIFKARFDKCADREDVDDYADFLKLGDVSWETCVRYCHT